MRASLFLTLTTLLALAPALHATRPAEPWTVTELPALEAPAVKGWQLRRELHESREGGYCALNILCAVRGEESVRLYESTRPLRLLGTAGPYHILLDPRVAHWGAHVLVVYIPAQGQPRVIFQSQQEDARPLLYDELLDFELSGDVLYLHLLSTNADTKESHHRHFNITPEPCELLTPQEDSLALILSIKAQMEQDVRRACEADMPLDSTELAAAIGRIRDPQQLCALICYLRHANYPNIPEPAEGAGEPWQEQQWNYVCTLNSHANSVAGLCLEQMHRLAEEGNEEARACLQGPLRGMQRLPRP